MNKTIRFNPLISEKSLQLASLGQYTFKIPAQVNKHEVANEIERRFKVKVQHVRITKRPGKPKGKLATNKGVTQAIVKAIVKLQKGESIPGFQVATDKATKTDKASKG